MIRIIVLFSAFAVVAHSQECNIQIAPYGTVCVCNATYCDTVPSINVSSGRYQFYTTSKSKLGYYSKIAPFIGKSETATHTIEIDQSIKYQKIIGFGGAFTDATGINIASLSAAAQQKLIESYFARSGIEYNVCRVPVGGTDFSVRPYTYDDNFDPLLKNFTLQPEDIKYKIPYIKQARKLRNNQLKLFGSAWTAPTWMKTVQAWNGEGYLQKKYYQVWSNYYIKFFDAYQANGIPFWGLTTQNEPSAGFLYGGDNVTINAMRWTPEDFNIWIGYYLGPTIAGSAYKQEKILLHDDQRSYFNYTTPLLENELTMRYADGVAVHWYEDTEVPPTILETVKSPFKEIFILGTEACNGFLAIEGLEPPVEKGSWDRGAKYIVDILGDLQYGAGGWVDWNMVLSETGGPNYVNNFVDAPILVNATLQEFYKQPMFYALGHFSKFVAPGSVRVETTLTTTVSNSTVQALAFLRPDKLTAVVIYNNGTSNVTIQVKDSKNEIANLEIDTFSINTLLFK